MGQDAYSEAALQGEALVDGAGDVWLPYCLSHERPVATGWSRLSARREVRHAGRHPFRWTGSANDSLHVLNGMGVALGDSIIGFNALAWLKRCHPALRIQLYRTRRAPAHVERLYQLASHLVDAVHYLPQPLAAIPADVVDMSDFLHWPRFASEPMVDFFMQGLGIPPESVPASAKANRWLQALRLPQVPAIQAMGRYVLLCDQASTALRSIPPVHAAAMVERLWQHYGLPVVSFHPIAHPRCHDVSQHSADLDHFLAWVRSASVVVGVDSSAIHIAAGFDVPTLALFVSIDPQLRARDYPHCQVWDARTPLTSGLHSSLDAQLLDETDRIWAGIASEPNLPWPAPAAHPDSQPDTAQRSLAG